MDRKEAIKILKNVCLEDWGHCPEHIEAFKEAIKALETLDKIQEITRDALVKSIPTPDSPYIPFVGTPNCCKNCSNHPSNGGSGICNCTLPYYENPIKWGVQGNMTISNWVKLYDDATLVCLNYDKMTNHKENNNEYTNI